ncbi:tumor necrosis factor receptor superfamily member 10A [Cuculus canorus]|uniref:tumor necrosis factor receptor superfamily member 10A n=1 Tax=Cuculus canorus TaxID=55661 RepID=UPI0023AA2C76|nr:tumor necrosis factor receptor superfamily member 10A [Cuculus canorus]
MLGASLWLWIPLVLLGTGAAAPQVRKDKVDLLDPGRGREEFYQVQDTNLYCKKCPAGTHVAEHCQEQNSSSKCSPCAGDEYIEYPNDFSKCIGCKTCRADQVQVSPCQPTRNTQCACKNGTFCSPDHPCEMCQKCRPRCSKDEVELAPCTPQSDRQCGPPTDTFSSFSTTWVVIVVVLVALVVFIALLYCCCFAGRKRDLSTKSCGLVDYMMRLLTRFQSRRVETDDNDLNQQIARDLHRGSATPGALGPKVSVPGTSYHSGKPRKNLVPVQGKNSIHLLRRSFDIFAQEVPYKDWKRFGRALDLLENDIVLAEMNDKYSLEPFFQMLNTWQNRQGMNASVNTLLETLHRINLGGIAEDISSKLVQQGYFEYEVN